MKSLLAAALAILALALFATPASAASFDCAQAGTEIEHMICGDEELSKLDELLGDRYVRALKKGEDPKAIKTAQRAWLRDTRNACPDAACLKTAYEARIADLMKVGWMTDEKARAICENIANNMNEVTLWSSQQGFTARITDEDREAWANVRLGPLYSLRNALRVDYDADGKVETLAQIHTGGSCGFVEVGDIEIGINQSFPPRVDPERFRWLNWGSPDEHYYTILGEPIIVAENLVSWLDPAGVKRAVCVVEKPTNTEAARRKAISGDNPGPCEAIEKDAVRFEPWETEITVSAKSYDSQIPSYSDEARASEGQAGDDEYFMTKGIVLDMDRDGKDDQLITIGWTSSQGCGAGERWIAEVDPETKTILNSPITELPPGKIFMHDGIPYLYADGSVQTFADGDFVEQCRIVTGETVRFEVVDFFPVETWAQ